MSKEGKRSSRSDSDDLVLCVEKGGAGLAGHEGNGGGEDSAFGFGSGFPSGSERQIDRKREPGYGKEFMRCRVAICQSEKVFRLGRGLQ